MEGECIEWKFRKNAKGYGVVLINGKQFFAHRLAVALSGRNLPKGKVCDHLCRNHSCINPNHIEIVTIVENVRRGEAITTQLAKRTHYGEGHPYDKKNTRLSRDKKGRISRHCRACYARREREMKRLKRLRRKEHGKR